MCAGVRVWFYLGTQVCVVVVFGLIVHVECVQVSSPCASVFSMLPHARLHMQERLHTPPCASVVWSVLVGVLAHEVVAVCVGASWGAYAVVSGVFYGEGVTAVEAFGPVFSEDKDAEVDGCDFSVFWVITVEVF